MKEKNFLVKWVFLGEVEEISLCFDNAMEFAAQLRHSVNGVRDANTPIMMMNTKDHKCIVFNEELDEWVDLPATVAEDIFKKYENFV